MPKDDAVNDVDDDGLDDTDSQIEDAGLVDLDMVTG